MDKNHPKVKFGKTGVLIINLGTPDSTDWWSIRKYLKEFILFWQESGTALKTWNVKFIDFVKRKELGSYNVKNEPGQFTKNFQERQDDKSWTEEFD